jgi:hypothetical protein
VSVITAPPVRLGMWLSKAEIDTLPTSGPAWTGTGEVYAVANGSWTVQSVEAQSGQTFHVRALAGALVFARLKPADGTAHTGADAMRAKVATAIANVIAQPDEFTSVTGPSRHLGVWAITADLINLTAYDATLDTSFRAWLTHKMDLTYDSSPATIRQAAAQRPNNIGSWSRWSRAAVSIYIGDTSDLNTLAPILRRWLGDTSISHTFTWHSNQSWQDHTSSTNATRKGINSLGAVRNGHNFDGIQPEDQRRNDEFGPSGGVYDPQDFPTPATMRYPEVSLTATMGAAYLLYRAGYTDLLDASDQAILRAAQQIHRFATSYSAKGYVYFTDSHEAPRPLINYLYGTDLPETRERTQLNGRADGFAWTYWTHLGRTLEHDEEEWEAVATVGDVGSYEDTELSPGEYEYRVWALNANGETVSEVVGATVGGEPAGTDVGFAATVPMQTFAATVTVTAPEFDAVFSATLPVQAFAAAVTYTAPGANIGLAASIPMQSLAATATHEAPAFGATFAATVPLQSLAGTLAGDVPTFFATFSAGVPVQALAATATSAVPGYDATFTASVPVQALAATVTRTVPTFDTSFAATVPMQTFAAAATFTAPGMNVGFSATMPMQALAATITRTIPLFGSTFTATIPLQSLTGTITRTVPQFGAAFAAAVPVQVLDASAIAFPVHDVAFSATIPGQALSASVTAGPRNPLETAALDVMVRRELAIEIVPGETRSTELEITHAMAFEVTL